MPWIEVHTLIVNHPKLFRLIRLTGWDKDKAIGKIVRLWLWCLQYCEDGNLSKFPPEAICDAIGITEDYDKYYQYLIQAGWIDEDGKMHDWLDYVGRYLRGKYNVNDRDFLYRVWELHGRVYGAPKEIPQEPKGKKKKNENVNPDIRLFIDWWYEKYKTCMGQKYVISAKDASIVKRLLGTLDIATLKKCGEKFFDSDDPFILKAGYTLGVFMATINKLAVGKIVKNLTDSELRNLKKLQSVKFKK